MQGNTLVGLAKRPLGYGTIEKRSLPPRVARRLDLLSS